MQSESLGAIVTRRVSPAALIAALLLAGCQSVSVSSGSKWQVKNFDTTTLQDVSASSVDQMLVNQLVEDYKKYPSDSDYSELALLRVLEDRGGGRRYFVFDLHYVDDVSVVYVLDSHDVILERFIMSPWVK
ncbi:hypothetical protein LDO32_18720 [Luteimonas sp. Y-2-2-4F]|nr:hypothetical protein [Luteimonas sp. Y-2-2-4F]MCD9033749.1 hypothetical protein [Luteimonas sp. Y-2-2-4F]